MKNILNSFRKPFVLPAVVSAYCTTLHADLPSRVTDAVRAAQGQAKSGESNESIGKVSKANAAGVQKWNENTVTKKEAQESAPIRFVRLCQQLETVHEESTFELSNIAGANGVWLAGMLQRLQERDRKTAMENLAESFRKGTATEEQFTSGLVKLGIAADKVADFKASYFAAYPNPR